MNIYSLTRRLDRMDGGPANRLRDLTDGELDELINVARKAVSGDTDGLATINGERFQWLAELPGVRR
jgi:hypothetical protein